jgi:Domain of unknown function (DUF4388)
MKGDLAFIPLIDLLQWICFHQKTGTVTISSQAIEKKIHIEEGQILYVSSNREGERLGEFIHRGSYLPEEKITSALIQSQAMKIRFTQRLIELNYFRKEKLTEIVTLYAKEHLLEAISLKAGQFVFIKGPLTDVVRDALIRLDTSRVIFDLFKKVEESKAGTEEHSEKFLDWE